MNKYNDNVNGIRGRMLKSSIRYMHSVEIVFRKDGKLQAKLPTGAKDNGENLT